MGGTNFTGALASVEILDPKGSGWVAGPPLITARWGLGLASVGGLLFAAGGIGVQLQRLDSLEVLDPKGGGGWVAGPPLITARSYLGLASVGSLLYAVGGQNGTAALDSTEVL